MDMGQMDMGQKAKSDLCFVSFVLNVKKNVIRNNPVVETRRRSCDPARDRAPKMMAKLQNEAKAVAADPDSVLYRARINPARDAQGARSSWGVVTQLMKSAGGSGGL